MINHNRATLLIGSLMMVSLAGCNMLGSGNALFGGNSASNSASRASGNSSADTGNSASNSGKGSGAATPAADTAALDPILANPVVDDVWAAQLTNFSRASFGQAGSEAYGLMRVIRVEPNNVILITEQGAWPADRKDGARRDLNGDYHDITWDNSEEIRVRRSELPGLLADGKILEVRRGAPVDAGSGGGK